MRLWLEPDEVLCLPRVAAGLRVRCEQGTAWLTQAGAAGDHILRPGTSATLEGRGKVTVWASDSCVLRLDAPAPRGTLALRWLPLPQAVAG